jgi:hypothetical protein
MRTGSLVERIVNAIVVEFVWRHRDPKATAQH